MSLRLNVTADPETRAQILQLVRDNLKPALQKIVADLLPDTLQRMIEKYLDHVQHGVYSGHKDAGKSRLALLFAKVEEAVNRRVDVATNDLSKSIIKQFETNIQARLERLVADSIGPSTRNMIREVLREELASAFKPK